MKTKTKTCFKCSRILPLYEFYKHPRMADGHLGKCKDCTKKDTAIRYYSPESSERVRQYEKLRAQSENRKKKVAKYQRKARRVNQEKYAARYAVSNAIRDGRLVRQPCAICGAKAQAHHSDYSKPLEVRWLCFKCHTEFGHGHFVGKKKNTTRLLKLIP